MCVYVYIFIYTYICIYLCLYIHIYMLLNVLQCICLFLIGSIQSVICVCLVQNHYLFSVYNVTFQACSAYRFIGHLFLYSTQQHALLVTAILMLTACIFS